VTDPVAKNAAGFVSPPAFPPEDRLPRLRSYPGICHKETRALQVGVRKISVAFACILVALNTLFARPDEASRRSNKPVPPFRIAGNVYYIGAIEIGSYLITTPQGHFLLDGGFVETAPQIEHNIEQLGFRLKDVRILVNSHAHFDHAGGLAELKKLTGAKFLTSEGDAQLPCNGGHGDFRFGDTLVFPPINPDQIIHDGEAIQLGDQILIAHLTPGHTRGNTTWTTQIRDGNKTYNVVFVGSQSSLDYKFVGQESYPGIMADFERSFVTLNHLLATFSSPPMEACFISKRNTNVRGAAMPLPSSIPTATSNICRKARRNSGTKSHARSCKPPQIETVKRESEPSIDTNGA
jgi:metallo-beta-lactamase class B